MSTITLPANIDEMAAAMLRCEQRPGQSVYQHGASVRDHLFEMLHHLRTGQALDGWRVPDWFIKYGQQILQNIHSDGILHDYTLFHDCGKPYIREIDAEGKVHFPDHAKVSQEVWESIGGCSIVGKLIANDMVLHTATAEEISEKWSGDFTIEDFCTLLLAALAEVHSNAKMFDAVLGVDSTSFKIKWKQLERRGRQICKHYFGGQ